MAISQAILGKGGMAAMRNKQRTMASGNSYRTPPWLLKYIGTEFRTNYDPCPFNLTFDPDKDEDGLATDWTGRIVYCNPPYNNIFPWVQKALSSQCITVLLLPARTDTLWFNLLIHAGVEIRYMQKRIDFIDLDGSTKARPSESSILVIVRN